MKVFILGSCVTRDAFTPKTNSEFTIVDYYARYSLARIPYPAIKIPEDVIDQNISSEFQKRLLRVELSNQILEKIHSLTFDKIIIDCVDDRFGLINFKNSYITHSNELIRSKVLENTSSHHITINDDLFYYLWEKGFVSLLEAVGAEKVIFNSVYWAQQLSSGDDFANQSVINSGNVMSEKIYSIASKYISAEQFVDYPKDIFIGDINHKWGPSPFHYTESVYEYLIRFLRKL